MLTYTYDMFHTMSQVYTHRIWPWLPADSVFTLRDLGSLLTGLLFVSRLAEIVRKHEPNAAGPIIMFHEVATLVHLIESSP